MISFDRCQPTFYSHPDLIPFAREDYQCIDFELPTIVTSFDYWEAMYRKENEEKQELQEQLQTLQM